MGSFIFPSNVSYALVSCCEEYDKDEREEEGKGTSNAPLAEDNAEILG